MVLYGFVMSNIYTKIFGGVKCESSSFKLCICCMPRTWIIHCYCFQYELSLPLRGLFFPLFLSLSLFPSLVMSYYIPCMQENDELKWPRFVWLHKSGPISICHGCVPIGGIWILYQTRQQSKKDNLFSTSSASSYCVAGMATRSTWKFQFKHMLITKPNGEWFFHRMNVNPFENMVTHNAQLIFSVKQRSWTMESKQFIRVCVCVFVHYVIWLSHWMLRFEDVWIIFSKALFRSLS